MVKVAIGLGSNLGDRVRHITEATTALSNLAKLHRVSSVYETAPIGGPGQGAYLNAVVVLETELSPERLLDECMRIERDQDRERTERWGPRTLDLDILLYGSDTVDEAGLEVPHPRMTQRRFVLEPLLEVWPDAELPDGTPLAEYTAAVADQEVRRYESVAPERRTSIALLLLVVLGALAIWWIGDWLL
ncbi:MAG: 2-amino-4-hydroxy-6-hydroxymethyldihydropteridine diphosphokinase [Acidimicrobiia bacterium]|nr:2-amino-4-hydroxy-6-hydroxymethyldihydropteridine diphosphokinase [Acidimicrobiia bacterium]